MESDLTILLGEMRSKIVHILLDGEIGIEDLKKRAGINSTALRIHLEKLERDGIVSSYVKKGSVGRPKKIYALTENGYELFPKHYDLLFSYLIQSIEKRDGVEGVRRYINDMVSMLTKNDKFEGTSKAEMLINLLAYLNRAGFYAEGVIDDIKHEIIIKRKNCIFRKVSKTMPAILCHMFEDELIHKYFAGDNFKISERSSNDYCITKISYN